MQASKRMNNKRKCGFCKTIFPSQKTYNAHVNTCPESQKKTSRKGDV